MVKTQKLYFSPDVVLYPLLFVIIMWLVFWFEIRFGEDFTPYGIHPGRVEGIRGVLFGPFIHGNLKHLFNNSIPMLVLGTALFYFYRPLRWQVFILGFVITGLITWGIGRPANHIGASGIVYLLASFLFFKGIISKQYQLTALSFAVVFVYGSLLWYVFPLDTHISWEGHLSGFGVGLLLAFLYKGKATVTNKKFDWEAEDYLPENDPFMQQFDADGNFIEIKQTPDDKQLSTTSKNDIGVVYTIVKQKKE
ncbi:MAG: rhomboid family intramembrane serine protease [Patiriisocius sp.]|jgi:membrane associated rhomboid family serine protease